MAEEIKRIGFDVDGVLADFISAYRDTATSLGFVTDPSTWDLGMSEEQVDQCWKRIKDTENFWEKLPPISQDLFRLFPEKHVVYFVTSRVPTIGRTVERQTAMWLYIQFGIKFPQVIVVEPASQKIPIYNALRLNAFIDDKSSTVKQMFQAGQNVFVYDQPWNQDVADCPRVKSVKEYLERIEI